MKILLPEQDRELKALVYDVMGAVRFAVMISFLTAICQLLWNFLATTLFTAPTVTFYQAQAIAYLWLTACALYHTIHGKGKS